jgi:lysozyme
MADKKDKSLISSRGEEILRVRREKLGMQSAGETRDRMKIAGKELELERTMADQTIDNQERLLRVSAIQAEIEAARQRIGERGPRSIGIESAFQTSIRTATGSRATKEDISRYQHSSAYTGPAIALASSQSTSAIERQVQKSQLELGRQDERIREAAANLTPGGSDKHLQHMIRNREGMLREIGIGQAAIHEQRKMGIDTRSQYHSTREFAEKTSRALGERDIKNLAKSGGISLDADKQLETAQRKMIAAFEAFDKALKTGAENVDELGKAASAAKQDVEQKASAAKALQQAGMGSKADILSTIGTGLQVGGAIVNAGGDMYRQWTSEKALGTTRLNTGVINLANQRYDDARAAASGDAAAILRLRSNSWGKSMEFGKEVSKDETRAATANMVGSGMTAAGSLIKGGVAGAATGAAIGSLFGGIGAVPGALIGGTIGAIGGGLSAAAGGITQTSGQIARLSSDQVQTSAFLEGEQAKRQEQDAKNYMKAQVLQKAMDFTRQSWRASSGAGSDRAGILGEVRDVGFQKNLAKKYGINLEESAGLMAAGIGNIGGNFAASDITSAGMFAKAGFGSSEQYMSLRGQMSAAGGGTKDNLETILRNAVAAGMDSSKNVADMVRTMSSVAARTSAGGVSTFGGAAAATARSIEALTSQGVDKNLAASAAGLTAATSDDILRKRNIDIPSMVQSAQMLEKFGLKPGSVAGEAASKLQAPQAEALLKVLQDPNATEEQKQKAIDQAGQGLWLKGGDKDAAQKIKDLSKINLKKVYTEKYQAFGWSKDDYNLMMKNIDNPDSLSKTEKARVESFTRAADQALRGFTESHESYSAYGDVGKKAGESSSTYGGRRGGGKGGKFTSMEDFIIQEEGVRNNVYKDIAGNDTVGVGHLLKPGESRAPRTDKEVKDLLKKDLASHQTWRQSLKSGVQLTPQQETALTSLEFNVGGGKLGSIMDKINSGDMSGAADKFLEFNKVGGQFNKAIYGRRTRERELFLSKEDSAANTDAGAGMDSASAQGDVTQYAAGLKDMNANLANIIKTMEKEATNLDPKNFAKIVEGSAGTLDKSVERLARTVDALNLKLQGDTKGASGIIQDLKSNANPNQNKPGGVTPPAGKT